MRNLFVLSSLLFTACGGDDVQVGDDQEVITTITLTFDTPVDEPLVVELDDPDGDGGNPPTIDPINLISGRIYDVDVAFQNRLEDPPEEITDEVRDESADHQVFFTGTAVNGPASNQPDAQLDHMYVDQDANGLPIGLQNVMTTTTGNEGTGQLTVTLRHLPELNGSPQKTADLADGVKTSGIGSIAGDTDATATFSVTVTAP